MLLRKKRARVRLPGVYEYVLYHILENNQEIKYQLNRKQIYKSQSYAYIMQTSERPLTGMLRNAERGQGEGCWRGDVFLEPIGDTSGVSDQAFTGEFLGAHPGTNLWGVPTLGVQSQSQGDAEGLGLPQTLGSWRPRPGSGRPAP